MHSNRLKCCSECLNGIAEKKNVSTFQLTYFRASISGAAVFVLFWLAQQSVVHIFSSFFPLPCSSCYRSLSFNLTMCLAVFFLPRSATKHGFIYVAAFCFDYEIGKIEAHTTKQTVVEHIV